MARNDHAGLARRRSRFYLTYQFFRSISKLVAAIHARLTISLLSSLRINYRPRWLRRLAGPQDTEKYRIAATRPLRRAETPAAPWQSRPDGSFDVETFAKERLRQSGFYDEPEAPESKERLDEYLYSWWRNGGSWGDVDSSNDYVPTDDDDVTSVISFATTTDNEDWSDIEDDGQRTPTRET